MKKALLMSIKAGYGHHSTAKAIEDYFRAQNIECEMLDTLEYIQPLISDSVNKGYLFSTKYLPDMFGKAYERLDKKEEPYHKMSPISLLSNAVSRKLYDYINEYKPDVIIGTHSFASMVITYLKEKEVIDCPTIGIVTDFTIHPFWESTSLDYYVLASEQLENQAMKKGIKKDRILSTGIPVKKEFSNKISKKEARNKLELKDKKTILLMMGSMGFGNIVEMVESIDGVNTDFQVLCVCGNNKKVQREVENMEWKKDIHVYGFVDNIHVMMDAADIIITKPGGLTTSEALAKCLPTILVEPIPGQEDRNREFLVNNGAAMMVTKTFPIDEALFELLNNYWRLDLLEKSVSNLSKPYATKDLCEFVIQELWNKR